MILMIFHSFVNIFAGGRSEIKTILFFTYLFFLSVIFILFKKFKLKNLKWFWVGVSILCMYLYGLLLHIVYLINNNLKITDFVITGNNGEISSSVIYHTHIAKAFIGQIFSVFGKIKFETTDAGGAYLGIFPNIIFLIGSALLVILIIGVVYYFHTSFQKLLVNKNKRQIIFLILGYSIVSFSLIKTSVDGGFFDSSFIVGVFFLLIFTLKEKSKLIINYYYLFFIGALIFLISLYYSLFISYDKALNIAIFSTIYLLYSLILYFSEDEINYKVFLPLTVLFLGSWWQASIRDRELYDYSKIPLSIGQQINIYDEDKKEVDILKIKENQFVLNFSKAINKNITYLPVSVPGVSCMKELQPRRLSGVLITGKMVPQEFFRSSTFIKVEKTDSYLIKNGEWRTYFILEINDCTPEVLSVIDRELQKNNIEKYLIVNPSFYDNIFN